MAKIHTPTSILCRITALLLLLGQASQVRSQNGASQCTGKENSYLWKVHTSPPIYLFGTMHVPYTSLWNFIPENVKTAFSSSEEFCPELQLLDRNTINELVECRMLPAGVKLESQLSPILYSRVAAYLNHIKAILPRWLGYESTSFLFGGRPSSEQVFEAMVRDWKQMKPAWVLFLLASLTREKARLLYTPVVDLFLEKAAHGLGKNVQAIEKPSDQCRPLNKLGKEQVELALRVQLDYLEMVSKDPNFNGPSSMEKEIQTYRCGDFVKQVKETPFLPVPSLDNITATSPSLNETEMEVIRTTEKFLQRQMVIKRNRKMMQKIEALINSERNNTYFLGLGAGHLLSHKNVVERLRRRSFIVEHIPAERLINGSSLPNNIIQLVDPSTITGLRQIDVDTPPPPPSPLSFRTLSPERLRESFERYQKSYQQSTGPAVAMTTTPPTVSTATTQTPGRVVHRQSRSSLSEPEPGVNLEARASLLETQRRSRQLQAFQKGSASSQTSISQTYLLLASLVALFFNTLIKLSV